MYYYECIKLFSFLNTFGIMLLIAVTGRHSATYPPNSNLSGGLSVRDFVRTFTIVQGVSYRHFRFPIAKAEHRVFRSVKEGGKLFERGSLCFWKAEVDDDKNDSNPYAVVNVELPADVLQADGVDVVAKDLSDIDDEQHQ
jgi:hypothetical protein